MTKQAPVTVNNLPTKAYLEQTIQPTVMRALAEVCRARPDNPMEFVAYYLLKHNPNSAKKTDGAPTGYRHPEDKTELTDDDAPEPVRNQSTMWVRYLYENMEPLQTLISLNYKLQNYYDFVLIFKFLT